MKQITLFFAAAMIIFATACTKSEPKTTTTTKTEKITYSNQGLLVEQKVILKGNTVWGVSEEIYGTGMNWRDIVALNPFLQGSDRLYYNSEKKKWIVKIFPGEVLNIGGTKVYPSVTYEETIITTTEDPNASTTSGMAWWEGVLLALLLTLIVVGGILAVRHFGPNNRYNDSNPTSQNGNARANAIVHVNLNNAGSFDLAVQTAMLQNRLLQREKLVDAIVEGTKNGSLKKFCVVDNDFAAAASFREKPEPQPKAEPELTSVDQNTQQNTQSS